MSRWHSKTYSARRAVRLSALLLCCGCATAGHAHAQVRQPALIGTSGDGDISVGFDDPGINLPVPVQTLIGLPVGARPHGIAHITQDQALVADFGAPARLYRVAVGSGTRLSTIAVPGKTLGNGTIAVSPDGNTAIFAGEATINSVNLAQAVVLRAPFVDGGAQHTLAIPGVVQSFNTQAIAFAPDGRAFVCNAAGVSIVDPPYTSVAFTWAQAETGGTSCVLRRDGSRLAVTRRNPGFGIAFYDAPFTAASVPTGVVSVPAGVGPVTAMGVSPDGTALLVAQTFRPTGSITPDARVFVLRQIAGPPGVSWEEIALPASINGNVCSGDPLCPGFEDMDISDDGTLALITGNSQSTTPLDPGDSGRAPLVAIRNPFDVATRQVFAITVGNPTTPNHGRGSGSVRFVAPNLPLMRDGFE